LPSLVGGGIFLGIKTLLGLHRREWE